MLKDFIIIWKLVVQRKRKQASGAQKAYTQITRTFAYYYYYLPNDFLPFDPLFIATSYIKWGQTNLCQLIRNILPTYLPVGIQVTRQMSRT